MQLKKGMKQQISFNIKINTLFLIVFIILLYSVKNVVVERADIFKSQTQCDQACLLKIQQDAIAKLDPIANSQAIAALSSNINNQQSNHIRIRVLVVPNPNIVFNQYDILNKSAKIALTYFQRTLQVYPFKNEANLNGISDCNGLRLNTIVTPDLEKIDLTVFLSLLNKAQSQPNAIASATACYRTNLQSKRPYFGQITYYKINIQSFLNNNSKSFHQLILISLHQLTHIFGLNANYYVYQNSDSFFLEDPSDLNRAIPTSQIIGDVPGKPNYKMCILPKVKKYVQDYFNCRGASLGAIMAYLKPPFVLVQSYDTSHWNQGIFVNEIMIPFNGAYNKMTKLTLTFLESTGWYSKVHIDEGWQPSIGKGKGCQFMLNGAASISCSNPNAATCDITGNVANSCQTSSTTCPDITQKCFSRTLGGFSPYSCFKTSCNLDNTAIQVFGPNNDKKSCTSSNQQIQFTDGSRYSCPSDFNIFCKSDWCSNWCDSNGLCINGRCILQSCSLDDKNCQFCSKGNDKIQRCDYCKDGFVLLNGKCVTKPRPCQVQNCLTCSQQFICSKCQTGFQPFNLNRNCQKIRCDILNCVKCSQSNVCSQCLSGFVLNNGRCIAQPRSCQIVNCVKCSQSNVCSQCLSGFVLNNGRCIAQPRPCQIVNCVKCSQLNVCSQCFSGFSWDNSLNKCVDTSTKSPCKIANCKQCFPQSPYCKQCISASFQNLYTQCKLIIPVPIPIPAPVPPNSICTATENCSKCVYNHFNQLQCVCKEGYEFLFGGCISCQALTKNKCSKCKITYLQLTTIQFECDGKRVSLFETDLKF